MIKRFIVVLSLISSLLVATIPAIAADIWDPIAPMDWKQLTNCDLVVLARYQSHTTSKNLRAESKQSQGLTHDKEQTLTLRVDRVLKGNQVKAGSLLKVELRHWYTIETGRVGFSPGPENQNGIPKLCYKRQLSNPGGLVPLPVVADVRSDALYFFPKAAAPALERERQIQLPVLETGWKQVLQKQKPDELFLLSQDVSSMQQRQGLEDLGAIRDSATLETLFQWLSTPQRGNNLSYRAQTWLIAIGDRQGDVYDRAFQRLLKMPREVIPYAKMTFPQKTQLQKDVAQSMERSAFSSYAHIMAAVDGERAAQDFATLLTTGSPAQAETVGTALGYTASPTALDLAFSLLKRPDTALMGATALRGLLLPQDSSGYPPRNRRAQTAQLRALAMPRLDEALHSQAFEASRSQAALDDNAPETLSWMRLNRELLEGLLAPQQAPAAINLVQARQVLLHPSEKTFDRSSFGRARDQTQGAGLRFVQAIDQAAAPHFIPLLVEMLRAASAVWEQHEAQETLRRYITLYPRAFQRELKKQGVTPAFYRASLSRYQFDPRVSAFLGSSSAIQALDWMDGSQFESGTIRDDVTWVKRYAVSPVFLREIAKSMNSDDENWADEAKIETLRFLLIASPTTARPVLERMLKLRSRYSGSDRALLLAVGIDNGHNELCPELLRLMDEDARKSREFDAIDPRILLRAKNPLATARYLKILDLRLNALTDELKWHYADYEPSPSPLDLLLALFIEHPQEFFARVARLVRSPMLSARSVGEESLQNTLFWNLDLEAHDLKHDRDLKLKTIEPLLTRLGSLKEQELRSLLLETLGASLPPAPSEQQKVLLRLAFSFDSAVAHNALRLLALMRGDDSPEALAGLPAPEKAIAFEALLADRAQSPSLQTSK